MKIIAIVFFGLSLLSNGAEASRFFANQGIQSEAPAAFALQPEASEFIHEVLTTSKQEGDLLVDMIQADPSLVEAISIWQTLSIEEQIPHLRKIFELECLALGIVAPELVIQAGAINGPAYFDFDPANPSPGRVILNPDALVNENKFASISLLIHETRHSAQFQMAFLQSPLLASAILAKGYEASFLAQKQLAGRLSFCDFLTLLNEYEAFLFGNYVVGRLTDWRVDMIDMGTFASQFDSSGALKIDLEKISRENGGGNILEPFNRLEQTQYDLLFGT
jgi:hypothetical protein